MKRNEYVGKYVQHDYQDSQTHMVNTIKKDLVKISETKALALMQYVWLHLKREHYYLDQAFQKNCFGVQICIPLN